MNPRREMIDGVLSATPAMIAAAPFGLLFGALAIDNGMSVFEVVLMSATIFAGASQMVGIDLFGDRIAPWLIVLSIFAVNFRHVLYSAVIGRHTRSWAAWQRFVGFFFLIDPQFAEAEKRAESGKPLSFIWFVSGGLTFYVTWLFEGWLGAVFGSLVKNPAEYGIDFLLTVYFLVLVMGFRKRSNWLPVVIVSAVVSVGAYMLVGSPWHVSIGAIAGVAVAAAIGGRPKIMVE
ncbi:AzlC family ABC transporter permease [Oricola sp.]|uniref:AzlC family ABC transporter permease n=1 Tax=Oricola sp. TaxID=1979950 RepID=UPI00320BD430|nr:AzlC family ABC transporter permease [Oricola sp.]